MRSILGGGRRRPAAFAARGYDARVTAPVVVILAAGQGTRMRSATPKLLHPLCGRPVIAWPIAAARAAGASKVVVVGGPDRALEPFVTEAGGDVVLAVQQEPRGTADAVLAAQEHIERDAPAIVINGDVPLMTGEALRALALAHRRARQHEQAAGCWKELVEMRGCPAPIVREAAEALAIHHEHRVHDLALARTFALDSLAAIASGPRPSLAQAVRHRLARIERKMGEAGPLLD